MSDISCARCGEPWDAYGAAHGDMARWEYELFKQGAGCPCCEGVTPKGVDVEECKLQHVHNLVIDVAWDDPHAFSLVNDIDHSPPDWKRPEDAVVRKCESCGDKSRIMKDAEDDELYWAGITYTQLYNHGVEWERAITHPEEFTLNDKFYCPSCVEKCCDCGCLNFSDELILPEGKFRKGDAVCEDCYGKYRSREED